MDVNPICANKYSKDTISTGDCQNKIILFNTKANFVHSKLYFQFHSDKSTACCDCIAQKEMGNGPGTLHCL